MPITRYDLTDAIYKKIVDGIRNGAYAYIAAEAAGVPRSVFDSWMKKGVGKEASEPFCSFVADVRTAKAKARLKAELTAFDKDAKAWLQHGPGKETSDNPGWTGTVKPGFHETRLTVAQLLLHPEAVEVFRKLNKILAAHPSVRAQVADMLGEHQIELPPFQSDQERDLGDGRPSSVSDELD